MGHFPICHRHVWPPVLPENLKAGPPASFRVAQSTTPWPKWGLGVGKQALPALHGLGARMQGTITSTSGLVQCGQGCLRGPGAALRGAAPAGWMARQQGSLRRHDVETPHVMELIGSCEHSHGWVFGFIFPGPPLHPKSASFISFQAPPLWLELGTLGNSHPEPPAHSGLTGLGPGSVLAIDNNQANYLPCRYPSPPLTAGWNLLAFPFLLRFPLHFL